MLHRVWVLWAFLFCSFGFLGGCGGSKVDAPAIKDPKQLFQMHCSKCHAQAGEPGGPGLGSSKGPNLTHIGSEPGHTAEWFAKFIRDPKSVRADAKLMPKFEGVLKDEEIETLAQYLATKK